MPKCSATEVYSLKTPLAKCASSPSSPQKAWCSVGLCSPSSEMLNRKALQGVSSSVERPSIGGLFVPTRMVSPVPQQQQPRDSAASPVCHVAGVHTPSVSGRTDVKQQQQQATGPIVAAPAAAPTKPPLRISWAGSGIYFWWQLGAVHYLLQRYNLAAVPARGASGGGLAAVLSTCGADPLEVMETAYQLSVDHNIWERPLGLMGTWGSLIEDWLDVLLPGDAAERCSGQVGLVVTQLPSCQQVLIDTFTTNADLINVAMASAHVPLFLDGRLARPCRGAPCVDGSFPDFFTGANCDLLTYGGESVVFDYFFDPAIVRNGRMDMLQVKQYKEIKRMTMLGYKYAQRLHDEGVFERFDCEAARKGT